MVADIIGNPSDVGIVQCSVHFVEHEERGWLIRVYRKKKGKRGHGLLSTGQMFHITEPFERRHRMVLDAIKIRLIGVFDIKVSVSSVSERLTFDETHYTYA